MSGAYIVQAASGEELRELAPRLAAQLAYGNETVNHFTVTEGALLGLVSPDKFRQGVMPRYLPRHRCWGLLLGELHECDFLRRFQQEHPGLKTHLEVFAELLLEEKLEACLPDMNGAFFAAFWDPTRQRLVAANDRYGLYPMYWSHREGRFCLAGRVLCSVLAGVVSGEWNRVGVAQLLTLDDYLGETTLVKGVETFPQATVLVKTRDDLSWRRYWHYEYAPDDREPSFTDLAAQLGERLVDGVRRQCATHHRIGVTLSGGLDSRCLVAAARGLGIPVQTFTWGKSACYDRQFARDVAQCYGTQHHDHEYAYQNFEARFESGARISEGLINFFDCHMLAHLHVLEEHTDLVLNGFAGGLVLGGSFLRPAWMSPVSTDELARRLFAWRDTLLPESRLSEALPEANALTEEERVSSVFRDLLEGARRGTTPDTADRFFLENRERRLTAMGTVLIREVTESAACFFDYDLIDLILRIPARFRVEHKIYRAMLLRAFPEAARIRYQRTLLPAGTPEWMTIPAKAFLKGCRVLELRLGRPEITARQSPVDFANWLRGPLRAWMDCICMEPQPESDAVLRPEFLRRIWKEHLAGRNHTRLLGAIAALRGFAMALSRARSGVTPRSAAPIEISS
ncbi:MAG: hypothetical protein HY706_19530 [Candidatus Hydrogenedentes bacterium]|nr:hypothetical protein [Candidatus Hydrogenedentota bacterium]